MQWEDHIVDAEASPRGKHAGLGEQLALIESKAAELRQKAFERFSGSVAAPGPFATAEAEALIGAPALPRPRRAAHGLAGGLAFGRGGRAVDDRAKGLLEGGGVV